MSERRGFFGFLMGFKKEASPPQPEIAVEKTPLSIAHRGIEDQPAITDEMADYAILMLTDMLTVAGFSPTVSVAKRLPDKLYLDITSSDDTGRIIGKEGATLNALQVLIRSFVFQKFNAQVKLFVDSENYHKKRTQVLRSSALKSAKSVIQTGSSAELRPMNAQERRVLHMLFKNDPSIKISSIGEGRNRRILLEPSSRNG